MVSASNGILAPLLLEGVNDQNFSDSIKGQSGHLSTQRLIRVQKNRILYVEVVQWGRWSTILPKTDIIKA